MKTLIILVLALVLVAGAWLSRPGEQSFRDYVGTKMQGQSASHVGDFLASIAADRYLDDAKYDNRFVYATVTRDGRVEYVGAFGRWFRWADGELTISSGR